MKSIRSMTAAALTVTIASAFASTESAGQEGFFDFPLAVNSMTVEEFVSRGDALATLNRLLLIGLNGQAIDSPIDLNIGADRDEVIAVLQQIEEGSVSRQDVPWLALHGIGGFGTRLVLRAFLLNEAHKVQGKIRDYNYMDATKSGHLAVDVTTQFFASVEDRDAGRPPVRAELLHWDIDVDGAYEVHERGTDRNNPFPQVDLALPGHAIASIWSPVRDLKYKLHAKGMGIIVRHIYRKVDGGAMELLPSTDHRYTQTDESCIDLLFNPYPPERELPSQNGYCLGRCEDPAIINTGG
jgi:hypothetical protein